VSDERKRTLWVAALVLIATAATVAAVATSSDARRPEVGLAPGPQSDVPAAPTEFDPIALARASVRRIENREAPVPPQCYTKTEGRNNPCWTCHTDPRFPNAMDDWELQKEYAFSDEGKTNHWTNLFDDRPAAAAPSDAELLRYVRTDNYGPLQAALADHENYPGYRPDLDFSQGFDELGFARDGSHWRAFRYKPFPGSFWPTNGSTDDVLIRLPERFRTRDGQPSLDVYRANLAILEASFASDPSLEPKRVRFPIEPLDETRLDVDLDGNARLSEARVLAGLPGRYLGDAAGVELRRALYPAGTEFLHSVRYLDPDARGFRATRMKELRYSKKFREIDDWKILTVYEKEGNEKDEGKLPVYQGSPLVGLRNKFGWVLQAFIEDAEGRLRLQTHEEHLACMGCHTNLGVTLDQTFAFPRKVPGSAGWRYQDLEGIADVPQLGHAEPEFLTYLRRAGGGDEFRENAEVRERFFTPAGIDVNEVLRAAPGGDRDLSHLVLPSPARALALNRAYVALVREQGFERGRDALPAPAKNVHREISEESTGLAESKRVYLDGQLRLDWNAAKFARAEPEGHAARATHAASP
jgi:hypothetical protein